MDTRSVSVMTVWDELRPILTRLRDDHRETLLEFPDPRLGESQPPPYQITLAQRLLRSPKTCIGGLATTCSSRWAASLIPRAANPIVPWTISSASRQVKGLM
jgi:hypothetical protein